MDEFSSTFVYKGGSYYPVILEDFKPMMNEKIKQYIPKELQIQIDNGIRDNELNLTEKGKNMLLEILAEENQEKINEKIKVEIENLRNPN